MLHKRKVAAMVWPKYSRAVDSVNTNARVQAWFREHLTDRPHLEARPQMAPHIAGLITGAVDYFEFGVAYGKSMKWWSELSVDPDSRFYGFDTFEGLPERWELGSHSFKAGSMAYEMPSFDDTRVTFIKGLFQDTLREFLVDYERRNRIVLHCDADLYSSTLFVLSVMVQHLRPGDIVMFDEFPQPLHEFRALIDWAQAFRVNYRGIASAGDYNQQVAIEILE